MRFKRVQFFENTWFRHVTIEPTIAIFYVSTIACNFLYVNLILQRSCRFNATSEPDLNTPCDDEKAGQLFLTSMNSWRYSTGFVLMIIFTIYGTSLSDRCGRRRRPLFFIPAVGQILTCALGCLASYFWQWPITWVMILETIVHGGTGGRIVVIMASLIYMCDISNEKDRTLRMGVTTALYIISAPIGNGVAGYAMLWFGLFYSFLFCTILSTVGLILGLIFIGDSSVPVESKGGWWQAFNPVILFTYFKTVFRKRTCNKRTIIILLFGVDMLDLFANVGTYAKNNPKLG